MAEKRDEALWLLLSDIQANIRSLETKLDENTKQTIMLATQVPELSRDVQTLSHILTEGNGSPALVVQVSAIGVKLDKLEHQMTRVVKQADPLSMKKERWKSIGKVAGILSLAIPGILA